MSKRTNSVEKNYIHIQKITFVLKICFNNDELILRDEKLRTLHPIESKFSLEFTVRRGHSLCSNTEKERELECRIYFEILLVLKS